MPSSLFLFRSNRLFSLGGIRGMPNKTNTAARSSAADWRPFGHERKPWFKKPFCITATTTMKDQSFATYATIDAESLWGDMVSAMRERTKMVAWSVWFMAVACIIDPPRSRASHFFTFFRDHKRCLSVPLAAILRVRSARITRNPSVCRILL